jgi:hypothetical protein
MRVWSHSSGSCRATASTASCRESHARNVNRRRLGGAFRCLQRGVGLNPTSSVRPSKPPGRSRFRGRQSARRWSCPASFTGPDPIADRVIATGQVLDGDVVVGVEVWRWLNDRGQVAFVAHFLTWSALYRADPSQRGCWRARARVARIDSVNKITRSQETNLRRGRHRRDAANESH